MFVFQYQWFWTIKKPLIFQSFFHQFSCFFKTAPQDCFSRVQVLNFYEKLDFGTNFSFRVFQKAPFGQPFRPSGRNKRSPPSDPGGPSRDPASHETIVILLPFGPSVCKKVIFSMKICKLSVFSAFLCAMFYLSFVLDLLKIPR